MTHNLHGQEVSLISEFVNSIGTSEISCSFTKRFKMQMLIVVFALAVCVFSSPLDTFTGYGPMSNNGFFSTPTNLFNPFPMQTSGTPQSYFVIGACGENPGRSMLSLYLCVWLLYLCLFYFNQIQF
jgi:hypothetical protein